MLSFCITGKTKGLWFLYNLISPSSLVLHADTQYYSSLCVRLVIASITELLELCSIISLTEYLNWFWVWSGLNLPPVNLIMDYKCNSNCIPMYKFLQHISLQISVATLSHWHEEVAYLRGGWGRRGAVCPLAPLPPPSAQKEKVRGAIRPTHPMCIYNTSIVGPAPGPPPPPPVGKLPPSRLRPKARYATDMKKVWWSKYDEKS